MKFHKLDTVLIITCKKNYWSIKFIICRHLQSKCLLIFLEKQFTIQIKYTKNKFVNAYLFIYLVLEF